MHTTQDAIDAQTRALETKTPEQEEKEDRLRREAALERMAENARELGLDYDPKTATQTSRVRA